MASRNAEKPDGGIETSNGADTSSATSSDSYSRNPSIVNSYYQTLVSVPGMSMSTGVHQMLLGSAGNEARQEQQTTSKTQKSSTNALQTFFSRFEDMQQLVVDAKKELYNLSNVQKPKQDKLLEDKNAEFDRKVQVMEKAHAEKIASFEKANADLKRSTEQLQLKYENEIQELKNYSSELVTQNNNLSSENRRKQKQMTIYTTELDKVKAELSECKTRLSRQMSNELTENNPQIADLSDSNRPTKLGEQHSELYDNDWTSAYEVIEQACGSEQNAIEKLLEILMDVKVFCESKSKDQSYQLKQVACMSNTELENLPETPELKKQMKEFRKYTAVLSIQAVYKEYTRKSQAKQRELFANRTVCKYIDGCVKLCWLMNAQDPPVVFSPLVPPNSDFDSNIYRHYTKSGSKVQFIVWPALLLHEGGPIVTRGVAQGHSIPKTRNMASAYESATIPTSSQNNPPGTYNATPVTKQAWVGRSNVNNEIRQNRDVNEQAHTTDSKENVHNVYNESRDESGEQHKFDTERSTMCTGSSQASVKPFNEAKDNIHQNDTNTKSWSSEHDKDYKTNAFLGNTHMPTSFTGSMRSNLSDQATRRKQTFASSVNVPATRAYEVPSKDEFMRFLQYCGQKNGEYYGRLYLGDMAFDKCLKYYNNVYLARSTYKYMS